MKTQLPLLTALVPLFSLVNQTLAQETRLLRTPAISARHIAFSYAGDVWLADRDGKNVRHLTTHEGHLSQLNVIDRQVLDAEAMKRSALLCTAEQVPSWAQQYADMGVTELTYEPMGDIPDALTRFAAAIGLV